MPKRAIQVPRVPADCCVEEDQVLVNPVGMAPLLPVSSWLTRVAASDHGTPAHDPASCPICSRDASRRAGQTEPVRPNDGQATGSIGQRPAVTVPFDAGGVLWIAATTSPEAAAGADHNRALAPARRLRDDTLRRALRAYEGSPEHSSPDYLAPFGWLDPARAVSGPPPSERTDAASAERKQDPAPPSRTLVVTTAADLRTLHKAILRTMSNAPGSGLQLSMVA